MKERDGIAGHLLDGVRGGFRRKIFAKLGIGSRRELREALQAVPGGTRA